MLNSSQTFWKYFCSPLFSELESCVLVSFKKLECYSNFKPICTYFILCVYFSNMFHLPFSCVFILFVQILKSTQLVIGSNCSLAIVMMERFILIEIENICPNPNMSRRRPNLNVLECSGMDECEVTGRDRDVGDGWAERAIHTDLDGPKVSKKSPLRQNGL